MVWLFHILTLSAFCFLTFCSSVSAPVAYLGSSAWATLGSFFLTLQRVFSFKSVSWPGVSPAIHHSVHIIIFHYTIISHICLLFVFALFISYISHMLVSSESIIQTIQLFFLSKSIAKVIKFNCEKKDSLTVSLNDWKDLATCAYLILWDSCTPYKLGSLWGDKCKVRDQMSLNKLFFSSILGLRVISWTIMSLCPSSRGNKHEELNWIRVLIPLTA